MTAKTVTQTDVLTARAALSTIIEPGDGVAGVLIEALGPIAALEVITGSNLQSALQDAGIGARTAQEAASRWIPRISDTAIAENLAAVTREGITLIDPDTIPALADLGTGRPVTLYVRGNANALTATLPLAVIGARASTGYGEYMTSEIVSGLAARGVTIVAGGSYGIDGAAHRAAINSGLQTIAMLAGGANRAYPTGHAQLLDQIAHHGAVISEVPMSAPPTKWRLLARNRIIAAFSRATIVVESGWRSGTLNSAGYAAALGRPLGAVPGPATSPASAGCHRLLREYDATAITSGEEAFQLLTD